jgi:hypothetical protein
VTACTRVLCCEQLMCAVVSALASTREDMGLHYSFSFTSIQCGNQTPSHLLLSHDLSCSMHTRPLSFMRAFTLYFTWLLLETREDCSWRVSHGM